VSFDYKANRFSRGALLPPAEAHLWWKTLMSEDAKAELYATSARDLVSTPEFYANIYAGCPSSDWLTRLMHVDGTLGLCDDMLTKVDRVTMAHSLEARVPLLDNLLLDFLASVPPDLKLRGRTTKYLLRRAMRGRLPRRIIRGKKRGFNVPLPGWLAKDLRGFVGDVLEPKRVAASGFFRPEVVSRLVDEHVHRRADHSRALWALIVFEHWTQQHAVAPRPVEVESAAATRSDVAAQA
jgi:asparagine synthase (glutamine-hydrolysing)